MKRSSHAKVELYKLKSGNILVVRERSRWLTIHIITPDGVYVAGEGCTDRTKVNAFLIAFRS